MPNPASTARRVTLVTGAEPGSTAGVASTLAALGAGDLGPGSDGRWVADLHTELLERCGVEVDDARPAAWFETGKACANGITRARLAEWLGGRFVHASGERAGESRPELVVADPGLPWFLGLWRAAALRCDAEVAHVVVLRPAGEVTADAGAVAGWVNRMLHLERGTRDTPRAFLEHAEVARDWTVPFVALGRTLGLRSVQEATANQIRRGHDVVAAATSVSGPAAAHPPTPDGVPAALRDLTDRTWAALAPHQPGTDPDVGVLDDLRAAYLDLYAAAESITGSSVRAARRAAGRSAPGPAAPPTVQDRARNRLRRALGR